MELGSWYQGAVVTPLPPGPAFHLGTGDQTQVLKSVCVVSSLLTEPSLSPTGRTFHADFYGSVTMCLVVPRYT